MEQNKPNRIVIALAGFVAVVLIVFLGLWIYLALTFRITGTTPNIKRVQVIAPFIDVNFSKALSNTIKVTSSPNVIESYRVQGKTLVITPSIPMDPNTTYTISVKNISSASGKRMADQVFVFKPQPVLKDNLTASQRTALLNNQVQYNQNVESNTVIQLLPFTGPNFEYQITYTTNGNTPIIQVTAPAGQAQQDALAWIKAQGQDTSKIQIQYINAQP